MTYLYKRIHNISGLFAGHFDNYLDALQKLDHFDGRCDNDKWLSFADRGLAIATKYQVVVHVYWKRWNMSFTYLPIEWRGELDDPHTDPPDQEWYLGIVMDNHFVVLNMEPKSPMASIWPTWVKYKEPRLSHWLDHYEPRLDMFDRYS